MDVLTWDRFYFSGRLQKPVWIWIDFPVLRCIMLGNDSSFCCECNHTMLVSIVSSCLCSDFHGAMWLCTIHALPDSDYSCFNYLAYFFSPLQIVYYLVYRLFILQLYCL